jgi:DNA invertase Pin-like site-specific DNA recombinase
MFGAAFDKSGQNIKESFAFEKWRADFTFAAKLAELERKRIRARVKAGLEAARAKGKTLGRPRGCLRGCLRVKIRKAESAILSLGVKL